MMTMVKCKTSPSSGDARGQYNKPRGIGLNSSGTHLFISDCLKNRMVMISTTDGSVVGVCGGVCGSSEGQMIQPYDVTVDDVTNPLMPTLYVADNDNKRVQVFV